MPRVSPEYLELRRQELIDAGIACFARRGFHATSMQDLLDEAGVSTGAFYRYFKSKDDLVQAIIVDSLESFASVACDGLGQPQPVPLDELIGRVLVAIDDLDRNGDRTRLAVEVWGEAIRNDDVRKALLDSLETVRNAIAGRIREEQREGRLVGVDPTATSRVLLGIIQGFVLNRAWGTIRRPNEYSRAARALIRGLGAA